MRAAILSNEKFRGVRWVLTDGSLKIVSSNADQEEAQEELEVDYAGDALDIGFNSRYLLDITGQLEGEKAELKLSDPGSPTLLRDQDATGALYVLMPMRV